MRTIKTPFSYGLLALASAHALKADFRLGKYFNPNEVGKRSDCWLFRTLDTTTELHAGDVIATGVCGSQLTALRKIALPPSQHRYRSYVPEELQHLDGVLLCRFLRWEDSWQSASVLVASDKLAPLRGQGFLPPNDRSPEARLISHAIGIQASTDYQFAGPYEGTPDYDLMIRVSKLGDPGGGRETGQEVQETLAMLKERDARESVQTH